MRKLQKFTAREVSNIKKPGRHGDGGGLWLQVTAAGTKSWLFRFSRAGKARAMGLGPFPTVSLAAARERATECRKMLLAGIDPIEARLASRKTAQAETARAITFKTAAEKLVAAHEAGWRNEKHAAQWRSTLATYCYPIAGDLAVAAIDTAIVMKILEPIWTAKPETASRVRGRIEKVLDWASARGCRYGENPARWRGHLDKLLPAPGKVARVKHHAAIPYAELSGFMAELRAQGGTAARALEFSILTAARTSETLRARRCELDLAAGIWTVPADRMKAGIEHRVPLSDRAIEILATLPKGEIVFPGAKPGEPLSGMALLMTLRRMGRGAFTVHGFRSTFRDWAAETTGFSGDVCEAALAHTIRNRSEAAYRRGDMLEKRRRLMDAWADFCASPVRSGINVLEMRKGKTA